MTSKKFSSIIENLGDKYIMEAYECAQSYKKKKAVVQKQWIALAACVVLIVAAFPIGIAIKNGVWFTPVGTGPITTAYIEESSPHVGKDDHVWDEWITVKEPTCSEEGEEERKCLCGETEKKVVAKLDHAVSEWIIDKEATETEEGKRHQVCTLCQSILNEETIEPTSPVGLQYRVNGPSSYDLSAILIGVGDCKNKTINIPSHYQRFVVTTISSYAFFGNPPVVTINMPDTMVNIADHALSCCPKLENVSLGNSVRYIGDFAFWDCPRLKNITIPASVTEIGVGIFYECPELTEINYSGTIEQWNKITKPTGPAGFLWDSGSSITTIHCIDGDIKLTP